MKSETIVHWWDGMSRNRIVDELIAYLSSDFCGTDYDNVMGAFNALRSPTPDPKTGLMPCGCGGKAVDNDGIEYGYGYKCQKCGIATMAGSNRDCAKEDWNTAMGWKGGAE
jgi:hypothetical protein